MMWGNNSNIAMAQHNELIYLSAQPGRVGSTDIYVKLKYYLRKFSQIFEVPLSSGWSNTDLIKTIWKKT